MSCTSPDLPTPRVPARAPWRCGLKAAAWLLLAACSPALDWRQAAPPVPGLQSLFPCRPERAERPVSLAGGSVNLQMTSCEAAGALWAIASAELADPARSAAALEALNQTLIDQLGAARVTRQPFPLAATSLPAEQLEIQGQRPDGRAVRLKLWSFARGGRIYRASVLESVQGATPLPGEALATFAEGLRLQAP